jgi:hypothetical protein
MKKTVIIFMGLGLLLAGCSALAPSPTATPAPTETPVPVLATSAEDIIGIWQFGSGDLTVFFQFDEDGTYRTAQRVVTNLQDSPQQFGQFTLEASLLTLVNNDNSPLCPGQSGTFEVYLLKQGQISIVQSEDPCTIRAGMGGSLERLSP